MGIAPARGIGGNDHRLADSSLGSTAKELFGGIPIDFVEFADPLRMDDSSRVKQNGVLGSLDKVPAFVKSVKAGEGRLMGFGHRVYKSYDPRATVIKRTANEVFEVTGRNPLLDIALELERIALQDEYFVSRKLYPNVDFYSGLIYEAMGFDPAMFPVLFAIGRTAGWVAQWEELISDKTRKIARPRQVYVGEDSRDYVPLSDRS